MPVENVEKIDMGKLTHLIVDGDSWIEYLLNNTKADFTYGGEYDILWFEAWTFLNEFYEKKVDLHFYFSGCLSTGKATKIGNYSPENHFAVKDVIMDAVFEFADTFTIHQCVGDSKPCILKNSTADQWILSERDSFAGRKVIQRSAVVNNSIPGCPTVRRTKKKKSKNGTSVGENSEQNSTKLVLEYKPQYASSPDSCCTGDKLKKFPNSFRMKYKDGFIPSWLMMPILHSSVPFFYQNENLDMKYSFRSSEKILQLLVSILKSKARTPSVTVQWREGESIIEQVLGIPVIKRNILTDFGSSNDVRIYSEMCKELNPLFPKVDFGITMQVPLFYRTFVCALVCWLETSTVVFHSSIFYALTIHIWMMMATGGQLRRGHEETGVPYGAHRAQEYWIRMFCSKKIEQSRQGFQIFFQKPIGEPDLGLAHAMAEFQSCLYMMMCLNCVIREPEYSVPMWIMFNGTFVYNLTKALIAAKGNQVKLIRKLFVCDKLSGQYFGFLKLISRITDKLDFL